MVDLNDLQGTANPCPRRSRQGISGRSRRGFPAKRAFDLVCATLLLPVLGLACVVLSILNPWRNPGPLFFVQTRMGLGCRPFRAIKFRTMRSDGPTRATADCGLELDRITPLGRWMRKTRLDELPQILNVLRGEMSLIGPRPEIYHHAEHFLRVIPRYRDRHAVLPGISGLAQTEVGYVVGTAGTRRKVSADLHYIRNTGLRMELWVIWRTLSVIVTGKGS